MKVVRRGIGPLEANCYIIDNRVLVDPGDGTGELDRFIEEEDARIDSVVITHGHFDHMLGAAYIKAKYGAKLHIGAPDAECLYDEQKCLVLTGCSVTPFTPVRPDALLTPGEIEISGIRFTVLACPGHTEGGISLYSRAEKTVFTGDTLFVNGFGRTDFPGGSMRKLLDSVKALFALPGDTRVYPGHGEDGTIEYIRGSFYR